MTEFNKLCKFFGIKMSTAETKTMKFAKEPVRYKTILDEEITEQLVDFSYRDLIMTNSGQLGEEVKTMWLASYVNDYL